MPYAETAAPPPRRSRKLLGLFMASIGSFWVVVFSVSLWHMPADVDSENAPELQLIARYLAPGKSRLGLTMPDGELKRYSCADGARLCDFVQAHSPTELTVRLWTPEPGFARLHDSVILSAHAGDEALLTPAQGRETFSSRKRLYAGMLAGGLVFAFVGVLFVRPVRSLPM